MQGAAMTPFAGASVVTLAQVPVGHLFVFKLGTPAPVLAIRAQDDNDPSVVAAVNLDDQAPVYVRYVNFNRPCVDLGTPWNVRIQLPEGFSAAPSAEAPGNLVIQDKSTCIICTLPLGAGSFGGEIFVDVATGKVVPHGGARWYITNWELGITDVAGQFHKLHGHAAPVTTEPRSS